MEVLDCTRFGLAIPILFQHNTYRYSNILMPVMLLKGILKCQQIGNISQMKNDAKISNKEKKNDELFGTKSAPQCSSEHYKSLKLN